MEGLIKSQKALKTVINKSFENFKKSPKERLTVEYIQTRLENLETDWLLFRNNNSKLNETYETEAITALKYDHLYYETEESYINYKTAMKIILNQIEPKQSNGNNVSKESCSGLSTNSFAKLPQISIPSFSGLYSEWITFRDLFISLVHNNSNLDNVQRLHYLKGHLTGEAEQLIRHTPISDVNYSVCWEQLYKRYNNKKYLANCIFKRFFGIKRINIESASSLKELLDTTTDCLNALQNLNINVSTWDSIVIYIVCNKLDSETHKQWELHTSSSDELPTIIEFKSFIENRFRALEFIDPKRSSAPHNSSSHLKPKSLLATNVSGMRCEFCSENHKLCFCKKFANQEYTQRRNFVTKNSICFNCLGRNHTVYNCRNSTNCRICGKRHHSLLHPVNIDTGIKSSSAQVPFEGTSTSSNPSPIVSCLSTPKISIFRQVLLATALIKAQSKLGSSFLVRALIDQGSQACFITEATVQLLHLKKIPAKSMITGLGGDKTMISKYTVNVTIQSCINSEFKIEIKAFVLKNITSCLPDRKIGDSIDWAELNNLHLADPKFNSPNKIDILLGADVYGQILKEGVKKSPNGTLLAQSTTLGWILSGIVHNSSSSVYKDNSIIQNVSSVGHIKNISVMHSQINEDVLLKRFWELEEPYSVSTKHLTEEEQLCQDLFSSTTTRDNTGRYIVKLPFKSSDPPCQYGNSYDIAQGRFLSLEKRLSSNPEVLMQYSEVINEYLTLKHMEIVPDKDKKKYTAVYLPYHAVIRNDKTTSKVRIVFDASCSLNNGSSLNTDLMVGPTLQPDLRHIIMRWRCNPICLVADIVKMYRQIKVAEGDVDFQRILWRDQPNSEIQHLRILRVTFGTSAAPYLAVRSLQQVAYDEGDCFPLASERILKDFYMDDLMTGCQSIQEGIKIYHEMKDLLSRGGFQLQKWTSSSTELLREIEEDVQNNKINLEMKFDSVIKILGLLWNRQSDEFQYTVHLPPLEPPLTKRKVISDIARLFDPLGWIAPVITTAKIFIQKLWLSGIQWDEELPSQLQNEWLSYRNDLGKLTGFSIPRWINITKDVSTELQGFCDASNAAYSAVVYLRVIDYTGHIHVNLLTSKTKVAPVKQVSIPRLELCGAVLLAKLLHEVSEILSIPKQKMHAWTDSSVVLAWISSHPSRWKTFVGNRVSEILTIMESGQWSHVASKDNPGDCASRGIRPSELSNINLWKKGPTFLHEQNIKYTKGTVKQTNLEERNKNIICHTITKVEDNIISRFSSLKRLIRVIAYCKRIFKKDKRYIKSTTTLTTKEIHESLLTYVQICQRDSFLEEIEDLKRLGIIKKNSKLTSLNPYLDSEGILRVGGRLQKSNIDESMKHPILLSNKSHLTNLIVADAHQRTLHGGPQLMLNFLRTGYWIINAKSLVRQFVRKCISCIRHTGSTQHQIMGQLPTSRVTASRPFRQSGVDYAGPILVRSTKGRGFHSTKGYICLFVCMCTRAVHLEIVSDLTSEGFLSAFRRFVARRGICTDLWSDNGTAFVGANRELKALVDKKGSDVARDIDNCLATNGTTWHFIPPRSPNFGGLWEAGVKSTKHHLKRVIETSTLTYEEMATLLSQIEACLNSRPISQLSNNPEDPLPLTPGHFLIGEPLVLVPDYNFERSNITTLKRWQLTQRLVQDFWRRWSCEYLTQLQHRYKWCHQTSEPNEGDIVLVKEDDLPPAKWLFGVIIEKHLGSDNLTRVVSLRCKGSIIKRPISKLIILPIET